MNVRLARPEDHAELERICAGKTYSDSLLLSGPGRRKLALERLRGFLAGESGARTVVLTKEDRLVGYQVLCHNDQEPMTGESQTVIADFAAANFEALERLTAEARQRSQAEADEYLIVHLPEADKKEQLWHYRLGFRPEFNCMVKTIPAGYRGPSSARYRPRPARDADRQFLIEVNSLYSAAYAAAGRDPHPAAVPTYFLLTLLGANLEDEDWHYIVLEDSENGERAGYIIVQRTELPNKELLAYYLMDIAAAPAYAGRGLSLYLSSAAETLIGQEGGGVLFGYTSPSNIAAVNSDRQLGSIIDSKRWGLKNSPETRDP